MNLGIEGKLALVTGPGRGIGRAIASELAKEGARLILVGRTAATLESLRDELPGGEERHWAFAADLMTDDLGRLAGTIRAQSGSPSILVHNLGGSLGIADALAPLADWERVLRLNLGVATALNNLFVPAMTASKWGRVVHISSLSATTGNGYPAYAVAKAAVNAYVKSAGRALARDNVVLSVVGPGAVELPGRHFAKLRKDDPAALDEYLRNHVGAGRLGQVAEIAPAVAFLCSEHASYAAGSVLALDGGRQLSFDEEFGEHGYAVTTATDPAPLLKLRQQVFEVCKEIFPAAINDPAAFFNEFHRQGITGTRLNELRLQAISRITEKVDAGTLIFQAFQPTIERLVGPDLLVQKTTNLVIQQPKDPDPSELHRDAPGNSAYEVVVWVPLVDCYDSKTMYILDRKKTGEAQALLKARNDDWAGFEAHCLQQGQGVDVPFGKALFFWTGLYHGSRVNQGAETRWSLNMRYKNLFSPNGLKDPFEYFRVLQTSPLTRHGLAHDKGRLLG